MAREWENVKASLEELLVRRDQIMKILIAEDQAPSALHLRRTLEQHGPRADRCA